MKVVVNRNALRWTQRVLFAASLSLLGFCGYVAVDAWKFQRLESRKFEQLLSTAPTTIVPVSGKTSPASIVTDGVMGRIEIPAVGISAIVLEGTSSAILQRAVGHIAGTAEPG